MLITLARKPLSGSVVQNALQHGCGALNIDACRVGSARKDTRHGGGKKSAHIQQLEPNAKGYVLPSGRWPANVLVTPMAATALDAQSGIQTCGVAIRHRGDAPAAGASLTGMGGKPIGTPDLGHYDKGGASRYFKKVGAEPC